MFRGIIFFAFLGAALASRSANQYLENVLRTALPGAVRSLSLDPAQLTNFNVRFATQNVYGNQAEADFYSGNVTGFASVQRKSECSGPKTFRGELTINCTLRFYPLTTNYRVQVRNGSAVYNGRSMGHVDESLAYVVISGTAPNYTGSVKSFQITRLGLIKPTFSGFPSSLNKYIKVLQDAYKANVSTYLFNTLQQRFVYALGRALAYTPMPRQ